MWDEAYFPECNITVAKSELHKNWVVWEKKHNLDSKFIIYAFLNKPWINVLNHWSFIFYTHGGN